MTRGPYPFTPQEAMCLRELVTAGEQGLVETEAGFPSGLFYNLKIQGFAAKIAPEDPRDPNVWIATDDGIAQSRYDSIPASIEAEQGLLGILLFDNNAFENLGDNLRAEHFYEPFHQRLFRIMLEVLYAGGTVEPIILMERCRTDPAFIDVGGLRYFADLVDRAPPSYVVANFVEIIYNMALRRSLIEFSTDLSKVARLDDETPIRSTVEAAETALFEITTVNSHTGPRPLADVLGDSLELAAAAYAREGEIAGISTGLIDLDQKISGMYRGHLLILAARPSMGKTVLALNIATHVARSYAYVVKPGGDHEVAKGGRVAFFSLEMKDEELGLRLLSSVSGVDSQRIRSGEVDVSEFGRLRDAAEEIQSIPLHIDDKAGLTVAGLAQRCRRLKRTTGLELVVVDYLQLLTSERRERSGFNRVAEVTEITQALKALAKDLNVAILALSQLSRKVDERDDKRPQLADLRESGSIEQDADVVMFIYREEYYLSRNKPKEGTAEFLEWEERLDKLAHVAEIIVGKQRAGKIGTVKAHFNGDLVQFSNLARN